MTDWKRLREWLILGWDNKPKPAKAEVVAKASDSKFATIPPKPSLHSSTFSNIQPSQHQLATMDKVRAASKAYADTLDALLPDGADKAHILRRVREVSMWANVAITRHADGSPRVERVNP